jgi:tryptophanyl-tRNA synthetase
MSRPRLLTGDTPTGRLHFGHYVGSLESRLAHQDAYDCYFIIANKHAFTTRGNMRANMLAEETLALAKQSMKQDYFSRTLRFV